MTRVRVLLNRARKDHSLVEGFGLLIDAVEELAAQHRNFVEETTRQLRRLERKVDGKDF